MSTKKNKSVVSQALLEMDEITTAIKEESKKSISNLLSEAVLNAIRENCNEEDDDYVVEDEKNDADIDMSDSNESAETEVDGDVNDAEAESNEDAVETSTESDEANQEAPAEGEDTEDDWNQFSKYQVGDNTYDLTGENDYENVVKVYKLLKDEDQVVVKQDGNKISLKDDSVGTEYVIDLGSEDGDSEEVNNSEEDIDSLNEGYFDDDFDYKDEDSDTLSRFLKDPRNQLPKNIDEPEMADIAGFEDDDFEEDFDEPEFDFEVDSEEIFESKNNNRKTRKPMKESNEVLFEVDLGYTDNYQDKNPIDGLSNNEPSKSGKSWHKGVPTGTEKPWAGETKSKGEPFEKTVNENEEIETGLEEPVEEATNVGGAVQQRTSSKSHIPSNRKEYGPNNKRHVSTTTNGYEELVAENKKIKAENKALKEALLALKGNLNEAYVTNVNLGKITKLFLENTTSQSEKVEIVNRFSNEAKTVEQSKALYESIKRELNKNVTSKNNINEAMGVANSNVINESVNYKSNEVMKTIDLMNRMMKC